MAEFKNREEYEKWKTEKAKQAAIKSIEQSVLQKADTMNQTSSSGNKTTTTAKNDENTNIVNEQGMPNLQWYYSKDGHQCGPLPEDQIIELLKQKKITEQSLVWNASMTEWETVLTSRFANLVRDPNLPPPLTGGAVSNKIIWVLAFAPLIGIFLQGLLSGLTGIPQNYLWFISLVLNLILTSIDEKKLKTAGHDTSKMGSVFLVPVYLLKRAKVLKQNYAYFIVWCIMFGLMFMPISYFSHINEVAMERLMLLIIVGTSIWVLLDAKTIGIKKGQIAGMGNLGPWGWFFVCLLLWVVGFPFYVAKRSKFKEINAKGKGAASVKPAPVPLLNDSLNQLEKLSQLKDKGVVTEEEFQAKKKEILNSSSAA